MSFGFGVGDFLAVIEVATKIRKEFAGAPSQYKALSDEVKNLSVLIQDVEAETTGMDPGLQKKVDNAIKSSNGVLNDLYAFIEKNKNIVSNKSAFKRAWQRFSMDSQELSDLRSRIASNILVLRAFTEGNMRATLVKIEQKLESQARRQDRRKILEWIGEDDYKHQRDIQSGLVHLRQPGTRRWLFDSLTWKAWLNTRGATLYCLGMPGAGKTFTSAMVIEKLQQNHADNIALAYIFCEYQQQNKSGTTYAFAKSALRMLIERFETLPEEIVQCYDEGRDGDVDQIYTLLKVVATHRRTIIIIDALDELNPEPRDELLEHLSKLQRQASINIFFTSREIPEIQRRITNSFPQLMIAEVKATEDDVLIYVDESMKSLPNLVQKDESLQQSIKDTIVKSTGGMFLLAHLYIISLKSKRTRKSIQEALRQFSEGRASYQDAYDNAMKRIQSQGQDDREIAMRTLLVLFFARRPLSGLQLCHFVAVDFRSGWEDAVFDLTDVLELEEILSTCAGLVRYQTETDQVQFVHQSTKEYLKESEARWFPKGELIMRAICEIYDRTWEAVESTESEAKADYVLLDYTRNYWASHHMASETTRAKGYPDSGLSDIEIATKDHEAERMTHYGLRRLGQELSGNPDLLLEVAERGQYALAEVLLAGSPAINGSDMLDAPLIRAVLYGHADVMSLFLEHGANAHVRPRGLSLLAIAAHEGHTEIMHRLFDWNEGAVHTLVRDEDIPGSREIPEPDILEFQRLPRFSIGLPSLPRELEVEIPLLRRPSHGHNGFLTEQQDPGLLWMVSPLSLAAYHGHATSVRFLLDRIHNYLGESIQHIPETCYLDAAICALRGGSTNSFRELLPYVDVNAQLRPVFGGRSMFYLACEWDREEIAELLVDETVSVGVKNSSGKSDLFLAVHHNMLEVVRRMLPRMDTALFSRQDFLTWTPLHEAAARGLADMAKILVQRQDSDVNSRLVRDGQEGRMRHHEFPPQNIEKDHVRRIPGFYTHYTTPLMVAAETGAVGVMETLLQQPNILVNQRDEDKQTALNKAAAQLHPAALHLLLESEDISLESTAEAPPLIYYALLSTSVFCSYMLGENVNTGIWDMMEFGQDSHRPWKMRRKIRLDRDEIPVQLSLYLRQRLDQEWSFQDWQKPSWDRHSPSKNKLWRRGLDTIRTIQYLHTAPKIRRQMTPTENEIALHIAKRLRDRLVGSVFFKIDLKPTEDPIDGLISTLRSIMSSPDIPF